MIIAPADHPLGDGSYELELAVLSAEDEHAEILRGEHHTTVSK